MHGKFVVGETYAFVGPDLREQYGEWTVTHINGEMVHAARPGRDPQPMVLNNQPETYWATGSYFSCEHIVNEPVIEEDWS